MFRYFKYEDEDGVVVINPSFVAHIEHNPKFDECIVIMNDGRRYLMKGKKIMDLVEELEMLANYGGI